MQTIVSLISLLLFWFATVAWSILFVVAARFIYLWIHAYYGNDKQLPPRTNQDFSDTDRDFLSSIGVLGD